MTFLLMFIAFTLLLAALGAVADSKDRRDARRRNSPRGRARRW